MRKLSLLAAASVAAPALAAQTPATHLINAPSATSSPVLGMAAAVRELPSGRVLVNDIVKRQLVMFDATLRNATVVADSTSGGATSYGPGPGGIIAYAGDSTLFIDPRDLSMFVIDPNGAIARVAAVPRSQDAGSLGSNMGASPAFDSKGRIVYRAGGGLRIGNATTMVRAMAGGGGDAKGLPPMPDVPDSMAIVRVDMATRKVDTAGYYKIPKTKMNMQQSERGFTMTSETNPLPTVDDWAVTSDGIIAVVRGQDYHVDWIDADGHVMSTAKIPFDWQRLSDDDKVAVIDSAKAAAEQLRAKLAANPGGGQVVTDGAGAGGGGVRIMSFQMSGDAAGGGRGAGGGPPGLGLGAQVFISPSELPDYRPAFGQGAVKADLDGNLWIRTSAVRAGVVGGPIYDVVNGKGELIDRVQLQAGRQIVGFGRNGVVYLQARDEKGAWLEKTRREGPRT